MDLSRPITPRPSSRPITPRPSTPLHAQINSIIGEFTLAHEPSSQLPASPNLGTLHEPYLTDPDVISAHVEWLLKDVKDGDMAQARLAAEAYETMRLWLAVCWEYAMMLMRAQACLRQYYGLPTIWEERGELR